MKILITGAKGFIGKNLVAQLRTAGYNELLEYDLDTRPELLEEYASSCAFVFHLAGVNRPENPQAFMEGNFGFTSQLLDALKRHQNKAPILITSSTQAALDNPYGQSKKAGEELLFAYSAQTGSPVYVYRLPNVFGKWCRPNYNSAVATFCYNTAHDLPITVNSRETVLNLVYIDDVVNTFLAALRGQVECTAQLCSVPITHQATLGEIVDLLQAFRAIPQTLLVPQVGDPFVKKLHATYLSYLPLDGLRYPLKMNVDERGSFTEILRTNGCGQFSVNVSKPGITKGNHWHHTKNEKFVVVSGEGIIRFRQIGSEQVQEYRVCGEQIEVIEIPTGCTHNIENLGDADLITFMWCNECFDPQNPDTIFERV